MSFSGDPFDAVAACKVEVDVGAKVSSELLHLEIKGYLRVKDGDKDGPTQGQRGQRERQAPLAPERVTDRDQEWTRDLAQPLQLALEAPGEDRGPVFFKRSDGTLADHPITKGRSESEKIGTVVSFTGCAFQASDPFTPLLIFGPMKVSWMTKEEGKFPPDTPKLDVEGWYQGAVAECGEGRLAFFGEAAMFTAQMMAERDNRFGMNSPIAPENAQFLLNVMHWLSRIL